MLSLGGIPPTVGFMGKLLIFRSAVDAGLVGLAIVGVLSSAAGVYYYLRVVVYMFMRPAPEAGALPERRSPDPGWPARAERLGGGACWLLPGITQHLALARGGGFPRAVSDARGAEAREEVARPASTRGQRAAERSSAVSVPRHPHAISGTLRASRAATSRRSRGMNAICDVTAPTRTR